MRALLEQPWPTESLHRGIYPRAGMCGVDAVFVCVDGAHGPYLCLQLLTTPILRYTMHAVATHSGSPVVSLVPRKK